MAKNSRIIRLPISFDLSDARQKSAYAILKQAGYGKRTPLVVDAVLGKPAGASSAGSTVRIEEAQINELCARLKEALHQETEQRGNRMPASAENPSEKEKPRQQALTDVPVDAEMEELLDIASMFR